MKDTLVLTSVHKMRNKITFLMKHLSSKKKSPWIKRHITAEDDMSCTAHLSSDSNKIL